VGKYVHHLPLYRQEQIYWAQNRVWLPRQNLAHWMELAADWLKPIYERIRTGVMGGGYVQVDETPVRYLVPGNGKTKTGYFWTTSRPQGDVVYHWETSRAAACLSNVLPDDFKGTVQCDGYTGYPSFARHKEHIRLAGCWAHVRRKVYAARDQDPLMAGWLMRQIRHLYRLERKLRKSRSGPQLRAAVRAHQAKPIYARLHRVLTRLKMKRRYLPRSGMGLALDYALNLWLPLGVYLDDGRVEIDQNIVENAIRPIALGKELVVYRRSRGRPAQRHPLYHRRMLPPSRHRSPSLFARHPHPVAARHQLANRQPDSRSVGQSGSALASSRLTLFGSYGPSGALQNDPPVPSAVPNGPFVKRHYAGRLRFSEHGQW
jgi:hypothetical protein